MFWFLWLTNKWKLCSTPGQPRPEEVEGNDEDDQVEAGQRDPVLVQRVSPKSGQAQTADNCKQKDYVKVFISQFLFIRAPLVKSHFLLAITALRGVFKLLKYWFGRSNILKLTLPAIQ